MKDHVEELRRLAQAMEDVTELIEEHATADAAREEDRAETEALLVRIWWQDPARRVPGQPTQSEALRSYHLPAPEQDPAIRHRGYGGSFRYLPRPPVRYIRL